MDRTDKSLGIVFTDVPDVSGSAAAAVDVYTLFESDFWRGMTEAKVPAELTFITSPTVHDMVKAQVDGNKKGGTTVTGTTRVRFVDVDTTARHATIVTCQDAADWLFTLEDGRTKTGPEAGVERDIITVTMSKVSKRPWTVDTYTEGKRC